MTSVRLHVYSCVVVEVVAVLCFCGISPSSDCENVIGGKSICISVLYGCLCQHVQGLYLSKMPVQINMYNVGRMISVIHFEYMETDEYYCARFIPGQPRPET